MTETMTETNLLMIDGCYVVPGRAAVTGARPMRDQVYRLPTRIELHLSSAPLKGFAKKIKAAGGRYSECRGDSNFKRFVTIPTAEVELADALISAVGHKRTTAVVRCGYKDHVLRIGSMAEAQEKLDALHRAWATMRGRLVTEADLVADDERVEREKHNRTCERLKDALDRSLGLIADTGVAFSCEERKVIDALIARAGKAKR